MPVCNMTEKRLHQKDFWQLPKLDEPARSSSRAPLPYGETTPALHPINIIPYSAKKALPTHTQHFL
jgi:hypothetical protein